MKLRSKEESFSHELNSHDIPPKKKKRTADNELITAFNQSASLDEMSNGRYNTRKRERPKEEKPIQIQSEKRIRIKSKTITEHQAEELTVKKKKEAPKPKAAPEPKEQAEEPAPINEELDEDIWNNHDKQVRVITENLVINLKNIPFLNELDPTCLKITNKLLGEGQYGIVRLGTYQGIPIACKSRRVFTLKERYVLQAYRELEFAAKLSLCRYINRYMGWVYCTRHKVEEKVKSSRSELYVVQPYIENADARNYLSKREKKFQPNEVLQASICLFSALTDAHTLNIGIVDLKLENFLIDSCGSGWLTDFASCINIKGESIDLDREEVHWTHSVAAPEMLNQKKFCKASDVFMGTLIIAELMTAELSDRVFSTNVLRRTPEGDVNFSSKHIGKQFKQFFHILKMGLSNEPEKRPDAKTILGLLLNMK